MLETYLTPDEYEGEIPGDELEKRLYDASRAIDTLTFNRIVKAGFGSLTAFRQEIVKQATAKHADFAYTYADLLDSPLTSYAINGVSMGFDRSRVVECGGVTTSREVYELLLQTGLCWRGLR